MTKLVNEMAELDVLVIFMASGTGIFNVDARRLVGLQHYLPEEVVDPTISVFKALQDHYDLCRFGTTQVKYADFLNEGVPFLCLTVKDLQGNSGQIKPENKKLPSNVGNNNQRGLHSMKSDLNITGNIVDLISFSKDEVSWSKCQKVFEIEKI